MIPLFDMMMRAQNGSAMEVMAKQFGMAQEQMAKATAALMPAFSTALKRNAANPYDFSALMSAMISGNHAQYFEDMTKAFTPQGMAEGNDLLGQLFGSKEVSRAIAAQAAQITGIGQDIYKQMLPAMAAAVMGGLFKQTTGQMGGANPFVNPQMEAMMKPWLEASGLARKPEPVANPFDNPFTKSVQAFWGIGQTPEAPKPNAAADAFAANPFIKMFQDMTKTSPDAPAEKPAAANPMAPFTQMLNTMFESGIEAQKDYQKTIDGLFDMKRPGNS